MEIQLKGTNKREHVSQTVAQVLIHAGLATEVKPELALCVKETNWQAFSPTDPQYPPTLRWNCPNCSFGGDATGPNAHRIPVKHGAGCKGEKELPPDAVAKRYQDLYNAWENRAKPQLKMVENPRRWFAQKVG